MKRILRPIFVRIARSLGILELQDVTRQLSDQIDDVREGCDATSSLAERRMIETYNALLGQISQVTSELVRSIDDLANSHSLLDTSVSAELGAQRRRIDVIRAALDSASTNPDVRSKIDDAGTPAPSVIDDSLYMALEDYFRGSQESIKERQASYLPYVNGVVTESAELLDIGCGRGEWLALLNENGIPARGIDTNTASVHDCREKGLKVEHRDLIVELSACAPGSLGAVTMFQVMEHLPFPVLVETFRLVLRALKPGGILIAEVPNAKNLRVSAGTFWIDPTHQRPLYPELLQFLAKEVGFTKAEGLYVNNLSPAHDLSSLADGARAALESVLSAVDTHGDFALIATA